MWRSLAGQARRCKKLKPYSLAGGNLLASSPNSCSNGRSWTVVLWTRHPCTGLFQNPMASNGFLPNMAEVRCFASTAAEQESVLSEEDVSAFEDGGGLQVARRVGQHQMVGGMSKRRYLALRRRQVKVETEAWEQAAKEYRELLADMCEQKLAPNLPYMKSLFLGWFEPLTDRIVVEQESCRQAKYKSGFTYHFCQLPAEMMSVITMHKLMALLMTGGEHGVVRVVHAACAIGEAIEQEAKIYLFLEKTKKHKEDQKDNELESVSSKNRFLRKKLQELMKKQKTRLVQKIVKGQSTFKPWGQREQVKVGSRLIELLISTAYIQPPINQLADSPPEIRPAFRHYLKVVSKEQQKTIRRYGVIQCDPLVRQGLERTVSSYWLHNHYDNCIENSIGNVL